MNNRQRKKLQAKMKFNLPNMPHFAAVERWNLFHTFSVYIAAGLRIFLSYELFGVPRDIAEKYPQDEPDEDFKPDKKFFDDLHDEIEKMLEKQHKIPEFDYRKEMSPAEKEWREILIKMLWTFEQIRDDYPSSPFSSWNRDQLWSLSEKGIQPIEFDEEADEFGFYKLKLNVEKTPQEVWDAEEKYREKIQDGLDLFAKHFLSLWD